ncbi:MAG: M20/M25/M40 family metallo-hydrolase [Bacteroidia bacterium]|nr:M20/M25/M40 family metallo-hydrolase [Bacteroidia bacterium]
MKHLLQLNFSNKNIIILFLLIFLKIDSYSQFEKDSIQIRRIFDMALENGQAYKNLRVLCKEVGNRFTGTKQADSAVNWGYNLLKSMWVDTVYKMPVMVPRWHRGNIQRAYIYHDDIKLNITALGGSVGTKRKIKANVVVVNGIEDLENVGQKNIKGKIVLFNKPFDPKTINVFESYGACVNQRYSGASQAAKYGAVGVLVRSMTLQKDNHPHAGSMSYSDQNNKIPAAAISTEHADLLLEEMRKKPNLRVVMKMNCKTLPDVQSFNVIAEIRGETEPETIITVGGHLDSWDMGEGAHDDGAGIVHSIELLNLIKANGYRPKHTIRVVLFMNEENGARGAMEYAKWVKLRGEKHLMALESDAGGHTPRGFAISAPDSIFNIISGYKKLLEPYGCHVFKKSIWGGGVDINPLKLDSAVSVNPNMILMGFIPDSHRYFDYHHAETDVFENVHKRELELGAGAIGAIVYLIDKNF